MTTMMITTRFTLKYKYNKNNIYWQTFSTI